MTDDLLDLLMDATAFAIGLVSEGHNTQAADLLATMYQRLAKEQKTASVISALREWEPEPEERIQ